MQRRWGPVLVVCALALLGACGDDDGDDAAAADDVAAEGSSTTTSAAGDDASTTTGAAGEVPADDSGDDADDEGGEGGEGGDGGATTAADLCAALDGVDLEALLAEPVEAPVAEDDPLGTMCRVESAGDVRSGISLVVLPTNGADNYENQRELFGVDAEVAGLGDAAFHTGPYLFVLDGDRLVYLQVVRDAANGGVDDADLEAAMRTILDALG